MVRPRSYLLTNSSCKKYDTRTDDLGLDYNICDRYVIGSGKMILLMHDSIRVFVLC